MVQLGSTTIYFPLFRKISDHLVIPHYVSVHDLCSVGRGVLCVEDVRGEYPAAPLVAGLSLEVGLMALAFGNLCLVHQFVLALMAFEIGKIFLTCQVGFGHVDHELGNIFLSCQVGFGLVG